MRAILMVSHTTYITTAETDAAFFNLPPDLVCMYIVVVHTYVTMYLAMLFHSGGWGGWIVIT